MPELRIISRSEWDPRYGIGRPTRRPMSRVVIHHAPERLLPDNPTAAQISEQMRVMEAWHAKKLTPTNPRIGYQFVAVEQTGEIWEGLGWDRIGAHVGGHNTASLGILILGIDGAKSAGSGGTWRAIAGLVREGIRRGSLIPRPELSPHRRYVATACPGEVLARHVEQLSLDELLELAAAPDVPAITPEVTHSGPPVPPALDLERITIPRREHIEEIIRVRGLAPEAAEAGLAVAEVLLRAVLRGAEAAAEDRAKGVADAVADWIKGRGAA